MCNIKTNVFIYNIGTELDEIDNDNNSRIRGCYANDIYYERVMDYTM